MTYESFRRAPSVRRAAECRAVPFMWLSCAFLSVSSHFHEVMVFITYSANYLENVYRREETPPNEPSYLLVYIPVYCVCILYMIATEILDCVVEEGIAGPAL